MGELDGIGYMSKGEIERGFNGLSRILLAKLACMNGSKKWYISTFEYDALYKHIPIIQSRNVLVVYPLPWCGSVESLDGKYLRSVHPRSYL